MLLSIIIPAYNAEKTLDATLKSASNIDLDKNEYEIIVIDDASTDNIQHICLKYGVLYIRFEENRGVACARNAGLEVARGRYILFLDSDDEVYPDYPKRGIEVLESNPDCSLAYADAERIVPEGVSCIPLIYKSYKFLLRSSCFHVSSIFRRELIPEDGWDPTLPSMEDWDFYIRYLYKHEKIAFLPGYSIKYNIHLDSRSFNNTQNQAKYSILVKHWNKQVEYGNVLKIGFHGFWEGCSDYLINTFLKYINSVLFVEADPEKEECDLIIASTNEPIKKFIGNPVVISYRYEDGGYDIEKDTKYHIGLLPNDDNNLYWPKEISKEIAPNLYKFVDYILRNEKNISLNDYTIF